MKPAILIERRPWNLHQQLQQPLSELGLGLLLLREDEDVEGDGGEDEEDDEAGQHQTLLVVVLLRAGHLLHTHFISLLLRPLYSG